VNAIEEGIADLRSNRRLRTHRVEILDPPQHTAQPVAGIGKQLRD
jgi:hypothetical protein